MKNVQVAGDVERDLADIASARAFRRLIWFLLILYVVAYLDRINVGFAALSMNRDLGLTAATFGLANTIFYVAYLALEIPSNALMVRYGARKWLARILVTWGIASTLTMFATGPYSLYLLRSIVGIFEAGFVPGVMLYLTYWFPAAQRGRATALFMVAQPLAIGFGSLISGLIMSGTHGAFGLQGWQWLFVIEGLPAVFLGIVVLFYLPDRPDTATWLSRDQARALERRIAQEAPPFVGHSGRWHDLATAPFLKLCLAYFCLVTSLNALATWSPLIVREVLGGTSDLMHVGTISAIPGLAAVIAMPLWGALSDKLQERIRSYLIPVGIAIVGWLLVALMPQAPVRLVGLVLGTAGGFSAMAILWTVPPAILSVPGRPMGTAILSCAGILGSITSPAVIGVLRDTTGNFNSGIWYVATLLAVSAATFATLGGLGKRGRLPGKERRQAA
ncbi:MAG: MFS transporter [Parafilimonas terrae]|nr:MFS transporter [Parafilimonas terrae]